MFIDESQDPERFVVAAVMAPDLITLHDALGDMRTVARRWGIDVPEFHESTLQHKEQHRLLTRCLELLVVAPKRRKRRPAPRPGLQLLTAYYDKATAEREQFPLARLLAVYQAAFTAILWALPTQAEEVTIVCDKFEKCWMLEETLRAELLKRFAGSVRFGDSQQDKPLQLADLVAGTVRRQLADEPNEGRFSIIAPTLAYMRALHVPWA